MSSHPEGWARPNRFMISLHSSARALPSSRRPTTAKAGVLSNSQTSVPDRRSQPLSSETPGESSLGTNYSLYNLSLIPSAPRPRIRTEENSPPPELATLVESSIARPHTLGRRPRASIVRMSPRKTHAENLTLHTDDEQNVAPDPAGKKAVETAEKEPKRTTGKKRATRGKGKGKAKKMKYGSEGEEDFEKYVEGMIYRANNPPTFIGPKKYPGKPLPETLADAGEWDKMLWSWKLNRVPHKDINEEWDRLTGETLDRSNLLVRFCKLKEQFAVSGGLEFPDGWLERNPHDMKYSIISERKKEEIRNETNLIDARTKAMEKLDAGTKAMEEIEPRLWETVQRIYEEEHGEKLSCRRLKARWENIAKKVESKDLKTENGHEKTQGEEGEKQRLDEDGEALRKQRDVDGDDGFETT